MIQICGHEGSVHMIQYSFTSRGSIKQGAFCFIGSTSESRKGLGCYPSHSSILEMFLWIIWILNLENTFLPLFIDFHFSDLAHLWKYSQFWKTILKSVIWCFVNLTLFWKLEIYFEYWIKRVIGTISSVSYCNRVWWLEFYLVTRKTRNATYVVKLYEIFWIIWSHNPPLISLLRVWDLLLGNGPTYFI